MKTPADHSLRVAMIGQRGLPATWGGIERHVEEIGARLVDRGHDVTVFCRKGYADDERSTHRGMTLQNVGTLESRGVEAFVHSFNAAFRTLGRRFDVVHFHAVGPGIAAPLPRVLSAAAVVQTIHGLDGDRAKWGRFARTVLRAGTWMSARVPHRTVTVSKGLQQHYLDTYGRHAVYVPNGITPGPRIGSELLRSRFGVEPGEYLLYVGRLVPEKAADVLIQAFSAVPEDVKLVIAGGSSHTDDFNKELVRLASRDRRVVLPGYVFGDDLAALYTHARAFVLPSLLEGLPLTLLEAVSYELPLVLSSIPPHLEVVEAERPGARLARPGDAHDLCAAIRRSLGDRNSEKSGAVDISQAALGHYSWDAATDLIEQIYYSAKQSPPRLYDATRSASEPRRR